MAATVLVLEKDAGLRSLVTDLLAIDDYRVTWARTFEEARSVVDREEVHLVLSDSGSSDLETSRENYRTYGEVIGAKAPVVLFTGHPITREEAVNLGCADVISKPFDLDDLYHRVRANLKQS